MLNKKRKVNKEVGKKWRTNNRKHLQQYKKDWEKKNPEKYIAASRACYKRHANKRRKEKMDKYYEDIEASRAYMRDKHKNRPWISLISNIKRRAKESKIPFNLTYEWAVGRWTGKCELTGIPMLVHSGGRGPGMFSPSIDRIKPEHGYIQSNCRIILFAINAMKSDGTDKDMFMIAKRLAACDEA